MFVLFFVVKSYRSSHIESVCMNAAIYFQVLVQKTLFGYFVIVLHFESKSGGQDQESIQSTITPDGKATKHNKNHIREPRG